MNHSANSKSRTSELIFVDVDIGGFYLELFSHLNFYYNPKFTFLLFSCCSRARVLIYILENQLFALKYTLKISTY